MIQLKDREAWLQARAGRIGGSDASAILGMNPYRTNIETVCEVRNRSGAVFAGAVQVGLPGISGLLR